MTVPAVEVDGTEFVVRTPCPDCGRTVVLRSEDRPNRLALQLAGMFVCDSCAVKEDAAQAAQRAGEEFERRFAKSLLPAHASALSFKDMIRSGDRGRAIEAAEEWAKASPKDARGVLLHGPAGTGKTRLAATAAVERLRSHPVTWVSVAMLIARLQASFSDKDRADALKVLTGAGALVLDDLDKVNPSETVRSQLFVAIENRVTSGAPLLVTTNLPPKELEAKFGEAIVSRLAGYCLGRMFCMDGPDRRLTLGDAA